MVKPPVIYWLLHTIITADAFSAFVCLSSLKMLLMQPEKEWTHRMMSKRSIDAAKRNCTGWVCVHVDKINSPNYGYAWTWKFASGGVVDKMMTVWVPRKRTNCNCTRHMAAQSVNYRYETLILCTIRLCSSRA